MEKHKMSKVSVAELASVLMEKHGLKRTEAELFIRQMVLVVNDGLKTDKSVKIKGLGSFKVQAVSARKSVDVNTGEAIIIEGRDKISFTADTVMRDIVNAPFAQFETVVINDGVDFSVIDEKYQGDEADGNMQVANETVRPVTTVLDASTDEPMQQSDNCIIAEVPVGGSCASEIPADNADNSEVLPDDAAACPDVAIATDSLLTSGNEQFSDNSQTMEVSVEQNDEADCNEHPDPSPQQHNVDGCDTVAAEKMASDNEALLNTIRSYKQRANIFLYLMVAMVVVAAAGFIYMASVLEKRDNRIEHLEAQTANLVERLMKTNVSSGNGSLPKADGIIAKAVSDSINKVRDNSIAVQAEKVEQAEKEKIAEETKAAAELTNKKKVEEQHSQNSTAQTSKSSASQGSNQALQSSYDKDPRIRTGAYIITGIANTVTVKAGQTIASISKTHLGPGMECYIEAVNGGRRELKAGDKVKIPALKSKKKSN